MTGIERHWKEVAAVELEAQREEYRRWLAAKPACAQRFEVMPSANLGRLMGVLGGAASLDPFGALASLGSGYSIHERPR